MTETPKDETKTVESNPKPIIPEDRLWSLSTASALMAASLTTRLPRASWSLAEDEKLGLKPKAAFFYVYYQLKSDPTAERPLTVSPIAGRALHRCGCIWA